jgi:adhesin HecA-like repeat protein
LTNTGEVVSGAALSAIASADVSNTGLVSSVGDMRIDSDGQLVNAASAALVAGGHAEWGARSAITNQGWMGAAGNATLSTSDEEERRMDARRREEGDDELPLVLEVQFDGEPAATTYTREELGYLKLAYAISVHRGQGSEFGHVVLALPTTRPDFMLRQLAYTGLTRAKTYCVLISAQSALQTYVQNEERVRRVTFLGDMLRNRVPK